MNRTAGAAGIPAAATGPDWRLVLAGGPGTVSLSRAELLAMPQHVAHLPIACVEGWSTPNQAWSGVRLRDLARLAGMPQPASVRVESLERGGAFGKATPRGNQVMDGDSLLGYGSPAPTCPPTTAIPLE